MKKQTSLLAILLAFLSMSAWAASSIVNVKIGSADAYPSLIFGQDATAKQVAAPPFSGMFGVKDLYLANTANIGGGLPVTGDYERLGTDIRASVADEDYWVLMAGADAKLYFGIANDGVAPEYEVVYEGASDPVREAIEDGGSLSVKAGGIYKFYQKSATEQNPVSKGDIRGTQFTVVLTKDNNEENSTKGLYVGYGESEDGSKTTRTFYSDVVTTDAPVYIAVAREGEGEVFDYYKSGEEGAVQITKEETADGWLLTCRYPKSTQMSVNYVGDRFTLTVPEEDESNEPLVGFQATAAKSSFRPITTTFHNNDNSKIVTLNWVIRMDGTLDFDQNGEINNNDTMYMYNFVNSGCPTPDDDWFDYTGLKDLTDDGATDECLKTALEVLQGNPESLDFDGNGEVNNNDTMYMYNFVNSGCPTPEDDWFDYTGLKDLTDDEATEECLKNALEVLQSLSN